MARRGGRLARCAGAAGTGRRRRLADHPGVRRAPAGRNPRGPGAAAAPRGRAAPPPQAARGLRHARTIERTRIKGGAARSYDLRPLVAAIGIEAGPPLVVTARTRFDPERGAGRPEEVVAAVGDAADVPLEVVAMTRSRLLLGADLRREDARRELSG